VFLAVLLVACNIKIGTDAENDCIFYDPPPIVPPSQAILLADTVDIRMGPDTLYVALEGYEPAPRSGDYWSADNLWLSVVLQQSEPPASFDAPLYPEPSTNGVFAWHVYKEMPAGEYRIRSLTIERAWSSCTITGDTWIYAGSTPSDMGMTDSVFVILSSF